MARASGQPGAVQLTLTTWLSGKDASTAQTPAGYHVCLDHLEQVLDTGTARPVTGVDHSDLEPHYAALASSA